MSIYREFRPTYLYIKQHSVTGKLYFGKTASENIEKYKGSGKHWVRHIKKHGKEHVVTLWCCLFFDAETISEFALMCSDQWDIVKSEDWLNFIPENGLDGRPLGVPNSEEHNQKISAAQKGAPDKPLSEEHRQKISAAQLGSKRSDETKQKMSIAKLGKPSGPRGPHSEFAKQNISAAMKGKPQTVTICPHCGKSGGISALTRHHFDKCKFIGGMN